MILYKSSPIDLVWYECSVTLVICDDVKEGLKGLDLHWSGEEESWEGCTAIGDNGDIYCIVREDVKRLTVLHECIHAINKIRFLVYSEVDLEKDETYVREVSWLQNTILDMWENYFNQLALKESQK